MAIAVGRRIAQVSIPAARRRGAASVPEASLFDPALFSEGEASLLQTTPLRNRLYDRLFQDAELVLRHQDGQDLAQVLQRARAFPGLEELVGRNVGIRSRLVRADSDGHGGAKLLLKLPDGRRVETVVIARAPKPTTGKRQSKQSVDATICVSSQAGCAMACAFCDTGRFGAPDRLRESPSVGDVAGPTSLGGKNRLNLPAWAILEQVLHAEAWIQREQTLSTSYRSTQPAARRPSNVVFMGMGEPLLNYRSVLDASWSLVGGPGAQWKRHILLSTVGVAPNIKKLGKDAPTELRLALSLHAPTQALRERLLPVAAKAWPLEELLRSIRSFEEASGQGTLFEYILLRDLNDCDEHADALAALLLEGHCGAQPSGINLIPYNPTAAGAESDLQTPSDGRCKAFRNRLRAAGVQNVTIRFSTKQGRSVGGACGQLAAQEQARANLT